jgi:hypothetical protein
MRIKPIYQNVNGINYWIGVSESGDNIVGDDVRNIPDDFLNNIEYFDVDGNPQWLLNIDCTVTSIKDIQIYSLRNSLNDLSLQMINNLVQGLAQPQELLDAWNASWSQFQTYLGTKPEILETPIMVSEKVSTIASLASNVATAIAEATALKEAPILVETPIP